MCVHKQNFWHFPTEEKHIDFASLFTIQDLNIFKYIQGEYWLVHDSKNSNVFCSENSNSFVCIAVIILFKTI